MAARHGENMNDYELRNEVRFLAGDCEEVHGYVVQHEQRDL